MERFLQIGQVNGSPFFGFCFSICLACFVLGARLSIEVLHFWQVGLLITPCKLFWFLANFSVGFKQWQTLQILKSNLSPVFVTSISSTSFSEIIQWLSLPINHIKK